MFRSRIFSLIALTSYVLGAPTVKPDSGTFTGISSGTTSQFFGIPVGNLRLRLAQPNLPYNGTHLATAFGVACPQQNTGLPLPPGLAAETIDMITNLGIDAIFPDSEDCLTINVITPSTATSRSKLPVVIWIYGDGGSLLGGFERGTASFPLPILLGTPVVLTGFGFLASKEVKAAGVGNLCLQDQRQAMRWVQKYISQFGGDPTKVTMHMGRVRWIPICISPSRRKWREQRGFVPRGRHAVSSSPQYGDITEGQPLYDAIVQETGCSGSSDTLQCLRDLPFATLKAAINKSPGDCDDEGTLFSFSTLNITTEAQLQDYVQNTLPDLTQGSPYDTGVTNALTPQFKRLASLQGDLTFQAPRRFLLQNRSGKQTVFAFLSKRFKTLPTLGSFHVTDLLNVYGGEELTNYLVRIVATLNPNGFGSVLWPQYTPQSPQMLTFLDGTIPTTPTMDTYRGPQIAFLNNLTLLHPL
ncbi:hypothetical protein D9613_009025 [Agrocybe pediades]|uniref:Carboxylesterase type B domain-containing protein n=1 Tax=Agrocybe pediades TaxID=84607 RepID=A0A8H4VW75_9AGAR|nr:hypothetical protein D9613_009025 [Agrocybe pediades]